MSGVSRPGWPINDDSASEPEGTDANGRWWYAVIVACLDGMRFKGERGIMRRFPVESWTTEPGSAGPQTFFASGEQTDTFRGAKTTFDFTHEDTGVTAVPGHYSTGEILGMSPPPGVAIQIQVAFRPAK
jgi:hypothetical protein